MKVRPQDTYVVLRVAARSLSQSQYILALATTTPHPQVSSPIEEAAAHVSLDGMAHRRILRASLTSRTRHCFDPLE